LHIADVRKERNEILQDIRESRVEKELMIKKGKEMMIMHLQNELA
jgi:hypothetical protein